MSSVSEVNADIRDFLMSINLEQYLLHFREFGFYTVRDCTSINDSVLHQIGISPTGHRRRILKQLQMIFSKMQDFPIYANVHKAKNGSTTKEQQHSDPSSSTHTGIECSDSITVHRPGPAPSEMVTTSTLSEGNCQSPKSHDKLCLSSHDLLCPEEELHQNVDSSKDSLFGGVNVKIDPLITKRAVEYTAGEEHTEKGNLTSEDSSKALSTNTECLPSGDCPTSGTHSGNWTNGVLESFPPTPFFQFQGEMVVNELYVPSSPVHGPMRSRSKLVSRPSRSFLLRHRPVPEIPGSTKSIPGSYFRDRRSNTTSAGKSLTLKNSNEDNSTSIFPYGETFLFQRLESSKKRSIKNEFWPHENTVKEEAATTRNSILTQSSIYDNRKEKVSEDKVEDIWIPREDKNNLAQDSASESEYSTVEECFQSLRRKNSKASKSRTQKAFYLDPFNRHSYPLSSTSGNTEPSSTISNAISPYACFYGSSAAKEKCGWLDKLSPQGYGQTHFVY